MLCKRENGGLQTGVLVQVLIRHFYYKINLREDKTEIGKLENSWHLKELSKGRKTLPKMGTVEAVEGIEPVNTNSRTV